MMTITVMVLQGRNYIECLSAMTFLVHIFLHRFQLVELQ